MRELRMTYHNASGKRNQMIINMDVFFPCSKTWLNRLIHTVIDRSDDPYGYIDLIRDHLEDELRNIEKRGYNETRKKWIRDCLDLIGGTDGKQ